MSTESYPGDNLRDVLKAVVTEDTELSKCCARREGTGIDQRRKGKDSELEGNISQYATQEDLEESEGQWGEAKGPKGIKQRWKETNASLSQIGSF